MTPELLKQIIADQQEEKQPTTYVERTAEKKLTAFAQNKEIIVLTGVRRCGKSVLLQHARSKNQPSHYYFNFEDERLIHFKNEIFETKKTNEIWECSPPIIATPPSVK